MTTKPDALPWHNPKGLTNDILDANNRIVALNQPKAALIVKAVNCHQVLVEALSEAIHELEGAGYDFNQPGGYDFRAALKQAEGD
jgi:hypothetical protein